MLWALVNDNVKVDIKQKNKNFSFILLVMFLSNNLVECRIFCTFAAAKIGLIFGMAKFSPKKSPTRPFENSKIQKIK